MFLLFFVNLSIIKHYHSLDSFLGYPNLDIPLEYPNIRLKLWLKELIYQNLSFSQIEIHSFDLIEFLELKYFVSNH